MEEFVITVVGLDVFRTIQAVLAHIDINQLNPVNRGRLGNFKTLTYSIDIPRDEVIETRRKIMSALAEESTHLLAMYPHGEWMHVYIFDRRVFAS
jgi:predicted amino acid-binding ACT domain protein